MERRQFLSLLAGTASLTLWPGVALTKAHQTQAPRLVVVVLRGALDGLSAIPPYGDSQFSSRRGSLDLGPPSRREDSPLQLDDTFALHPSLAFCHSLYRDKEFAAVHACALPYHGRSHFDAQDCLENGTDSPTGLDTGWLNRAVAALEDSRGLAISSSVPLIARGEAPFMTWSPTPGKSSPEELASLLADAYQADPMLSDAYEKALNAQQIAPNEGKNINQLPVVMEAAGRFLSRQDGPNIAMVQDNGWDTHANQNAVLKNKLRQLDNGIKAVKKSLGASWKHTAIIVTTEFGRTVAINGTQGTDHGTGSAVMLAGGAINGGKMHGKWPGLAALQDDRDLLPANDLRGVFKGVLAQHLKLDRKTLDNGVFPGSGKVAPMPELIPS